MIATGFYTSKHLQEEKEAEEYSQYAETLRQELLEDTIPIDEYIPKAKKPKMIGNFVINDDECGIAGGSVYYISNGERVSSPYTLYYKPTRIMLNDEAVDFLVNKLGPIFKDEFDFYSVIDINNMDTDNYDYIVIEVSIDDSKLVNEFPMGLFIIFSDSFKIKYIF